MEFPIREMKRNAFSMPLSDPWACVQIYTNTITFNVYMANICDICLKQYTYDFLKAIWQLSGGKHRTPDMRYRAYKPRALSTLLITRCKWPNSDTSKKPNSITSKFKQVVNLSATCFHVELEQFWHAFASRGFVSDSWAFLLQHKAWNCGTATYSDTQQQESRLSLTIPRCLHKRLAVLYEQHLV